MISPAVSTTAASLATIITRRIPQDRVSLGGLLCTNFAEFNFRDYPKRVGEARSIALQTVRGTLCAQRPNSRSKRCSNPFSDGLSRHFGE
jgi:hypothetical protein